MSQSRLYGSSQMESVPGPGKYNCGFRLSDPTDHKIGSSSGSRAALKTAAPDGSGSAALAILVDAWRSLVILLLGRLERGVV